MAISKAIYLYFYYICTSYQIFHIVEKMDVEMEEEAPAAAAAPSPALSPAPAQASVSPAQVQILRLELGSDNFNLGHVLPTSCGR